MVKKVLIKILDNVNEGVMILLPNKKHIYANKQISEMTGYSVDEILEFKNLELLVPSEKERVDFFFRNRVNGKKTENQYETIFQRKDKSTFPVEITGSKIKWEGKDVNLVLIRDLTKRKKLNEEVKFQADLLNNLTDPVFSLNEDMKLRYYNDAAVDLFGILKNEKNDLFFNRDNIDFLGNDFDFIFDKLNLEGHWNGEVLQMCKDDVWKNLYYFIYTLKNSLGKSKGYVAIVHDITAARNMNKSLINGNIYLSFEQSYQELLDVFEVFKKTHEIILITRKKSDINYPVSDNNIIELNNSLLKNNALFKAIDNKLKFHEDKGCIIIMNKFEYIKILLGFDEMMKIIYQLRKFVNKKGCILINYILKNFFSSGEFEVLNDECNSIPIAYYNNKNIDEDKLKILKLIDEKNKVHININITFLTSKLKFSRVTISKLVNELKKEGFLSVNKRGNKKFLFVTDKGKKII